MWKLIPKNNWWLAWEWIFYRRVINVICIIAASTEAPVLSPNECEDNVNCGTGSFCGANSEGIRQCIGKQASLKFLWFF